MKKTSGSTSGPVCRQWNVRSFPTIYVLDAKGVLRFTGLRGWAVATWTARPAAIAKVVAVRAMRLDTH